MERGWLIEWGQLCLGMQCDRFAFVCFTDPAAIRFARKEDAELAKRALRSYFSVFAWENFVVSEHGWG